MFIDVTCFFSIFTAEIVRLPIIKIMKLYSILYIYSWLSRQSTARGFSTGLATVGPKKVKAGKSVLSPYHLYLLKRGLREIPNPTST